MDETEDKIRNRAHAIWEREGRPHGAHDEHWRRAEAEHEATDREAAQAEGPLHPQPLHQGGKASPQPARGKKRPQLRRIREER